MRHDENDNNDVAIISAGDAHGMFRGRDRKPKQAEVEETVKPSEAGQ